MARPTDQTCVLDPPEEAPAPAVAARGELRRSVALAHEALDRAGTGADAAGAHLALAIVAREQDRLDDARRELRAALGAAEPGGHTGLVVLARLEQALVASSEGAHLEAIGTVVDVDRRLAPGGRDDCLRAVVDAVDAVVHLAAGDVDRAEVLIARLPAGPVTTVLGARIALARGRIDAVLTAAEDVLDDDADLDLRVRIEALVLACRAETAGGAHDAARRRLAALAELTGPEGHVRVYRDVGLDPPGGRPGPPDEGPPWLPLSAREQQVLQHLVGRLDNREIAEAMYISVNTVKTHLQSIYRKLGVESRRQAVERAVALRLL